MKKQIALVLTLVALVMIACNDSDPVPAARPSLTNMPSIVTEIRSVYPSAGAPGTAVVIFGENFGPTPADNYVTFDSEPAEITHVGYGFLNIIVPQHITEGEYTIKVTAEGRVANAPDRFRVTRSIY
ncbi:MAG TPA: IPT/TIG domain-containing protein [Chryseolinea sp.]